jgi:hypothetical protein
MEALVEKLIERRSRIRELIEMFGKSDRKPFPKWGMTEGKDREELWKEGRWGGSMGTVM